MRKIRESSLFSVEEQKIMRKHGITLEMARVRHKKLGYPKELAITKPVRKWVERV
ncbi:hypothetical protein MKX53_17550 [Psychrobacillus sp. FSL K6-4615]|uniref:hypothetical protein n=1 Tax=Psychrobacillus sp. FSL K6-4615 TaxID=2921551 RepID=UPI0030FB0814